MHPRSSAIPQKGENRNQRCNRCNGFSETGLSWLASLRRAWDGCRMILTVRKNIPIQSGGYKKEKFCCLFLDPAPFPFALLPPVSLSHYCSPRPPPLAL